MSALTDTFTSFADAIRSKTGTSETFTPAQMVSAIENIPTWGGVINPFEYASSTITSYTGNENFILDNAFIGCTFLSSISFPKCSYIGHFAFNRCSRLTNISFPECSYIGSTTFALCTSLSNISFPECSYIGSNAFNNCSSLSNISFPKCSYIGDYAFRSCNKLTNILFPKCSYIGSYAFNSCSRLSSLYLLSTSVVSLANSNAFNYTPLSAGGTGKIYVPSSLVATYKTATNWKNLSNRITAYNG